MTNHIVGSLTEFFIFLPWNLFNWTSIFEDVIFLDFFYLICSSLQLVAVWGQSSTNLVFQSLVFLPSNLRNLLVIAAKLSESDEKIKDFFAPLFLKTVFVRNFFSFFVQIFIEKTLAVRIRRLEKTFLFQLQSQKLVLCNWIFFPNAFDHRIGCSPVHNYANGTLATSGFACSPSLFCTHSEWK